MTEPQDHVQTQLRAALADRYRIDREIGRGGMATVYLARDLRHDRDVALKVLHSDLAASLGAERFTREIRLAARLQHPHILTVHDSGDAGGLLWFTMPFVKGESLRQRLARETQLPVEDAIRIAREVAEALDYAHREGVVHRDIKPENILLSGSHALVADFGIARALGSAGSDASGRPDTLTGTGMAIGTPAYMSPEQASGERGVDQRTDVYALGAVLYEMLSGEPPYTGPTAQAIVARMMTESPRPLHATRPSVSAEIDAALAKALARIPADRFESTAEFSRALERARGGATAERSIAPARRAAASSRRINVGLVFVLGLVLGVGALFAWRRSGRETTAASSDVKHLAVLPFENQGSSDDQYFADGMTDEIRGKLSTLPGLQVTAGRSAATYRGTTKDLKQIAAELGVEYLLVGKVRWEKVAGQPSRVRVSPELIDVSKGTTKWQQAFDASLTDVFQVQADVAGKVATAMNLALSPVQAQQLETRPTQNLQAYDAYLRGNELKATAGQTPTTEVRRAAGQYERAVALDSTFALAWAELARALSQLSFLGTATATERTRTLEAARRALALDPNLGAAHAAFGDYYYYVRGELKTATPYYTKARELAPQDGDFLVRMARVQQSSGRWEDALTLLRQAQGIDPRSVVVARAYAAALLWMRRYREAAEAADHSIVLSPLSPGPYEVRAMVQLAQGDLEGARRIVRAAPSEVDPTAMVAFFALYWDLYWVLDDAQQQLLLRLPPASFDDDVLGRALSIAFTSQLRNDAARAKQAAAEALVEVDRRLAEAPDDPYVIVQRAVTLALVGRAAEAVSEADRAIAIQPSSVDGYNGPYNEHLAMRAYIEVGQHDKALDVLERLLETPYFLSPSWVKIDPMFRPLKGNPRFERLVAK